MKSIGGDQLRFELKAEIPKGISENILQKIKLSPFKFQTPYPPRNIYNLYFDSLDLRTYRDNLSGASERVKFRYRWYDHLDDYNLGHFEVKKKHEACHTLWTVSVIRCDNLCFFWQRTYNLVLECFRIIPMLQ